MTGVPEELLFLLIFGVVWLAQFLRRQRRRQAPAAADEESAAEAEVDVAADVPSVNAPRRPAFTPNLVEGPRRAPPPRARPALASASPAQPTAHRYSRIALMGDRRALQNAVVAAAILQPCRAHRPHGMDEAPRGQRGAGVKQ